jgi:hypothetical protein
MKKWMALTALLKNSLRGPAVPQRLRAGTPKTGALGAPAPAVPFQDKFKLSHYQASLSLHCV